MESMITINMYNKAQNFLLFIISLLLFYPFVEKIKIIQNQINSFKEKRREKCLYSFFSIDSEYNESFNFVLDFNKQILDLHIISKKNNVFIPVSPLSFSKSIICKCTSDNFIKKDNDYLQCDDCGLIVKIPLSIAWSDLARVHATPVYVYDRKIQFKECLLNFQGKNTTIDQELFNKIKISKDVSKIVFLKYLKTLTKQRNHLEQIHILYYTYTKKTKPDLSHIENSLLNDFDNFNKLIDFKKGNFLSNNILLYQFLRNYNISVTRDDLLLTEDKKNYDFKQIFYRLNLKYFDD